MNADVVPPREPLCLFYEADLADMGQAVDVVRRAAGTIDRRRSANVTRSSTWRGSQRRGWRPTIPLFITT